MSAWSRSGRRRTARRPSTPSSRLPGSKSITARALVLAALADGPSRLVRPLRARDTDLMAAGLRALGVGIDEDGADWLVTPRRAARAGRGRRRAGRHRAALPAAGRRAGRPARSGWTATRGCATGPTPA